MALPPQVEQDGEKMVQKNAKGFTIPKPPTFDNLEEERKYKLERLAAAFRVFSSLGLDEGIAGHLTLRDPIKKDHFWVNPFGKAFSLINVTDLLMVNPQGDIVAGGTPDRQVYNQAAFAIHHAIHTARPDVEAACHSHSTYGRAFSTFGKPIDITTQDACHFYNDLAVYEGFGGVVMAPEEGNNISKALGQKKAAILQNHGLLTTGASIEEATWWFISLEGLCHAQLLVDAATARAGRKPILVGEDEAMFTYMTTGTHDAGWFQAQPYFQKIDAQTNRSYVN